MRNVEFNMSVDVIRDFPETQIRFVAARGLRNAQSWPVVAERLRRLEEEVAGGGLGSFDSGDPVIASWHDAFRRFGTNPRRFRPSVEALGRRLTSSGALPRINPAVDAYNLVSVTYRVPAGAFDLARLEHRVTLRHSRAGDRFIPLGEPGEVEDVAPGEVVYAQGDQVLTRRWNHRDCDQTKITNESTEVVFILERVSRTAVPDQAIRAAQITLAELVRPYAEQVSLAVIEAETPSTGLRDDEPGLAISPPHRRGKR